MRHSPHHAVTDDAVVRELIAENPWATLVSEADGQLVASHCWYAPGAVRAPTWNFSVAHCYGVPEVLEPDENVRVLTRLVAHFEERVEEPLWLETETAQRLAPGTVGIRLPISHFVCKVKMSADKDPDSQERVLAQLRGSGPYANPALADEMERALRR